MGLLLVENNAFYPSHAVKTRCLCWGLWGAKSCVSLDSICFYWFEWELGVNWLLAMDIQ